MLHSFGEGIHPGITLAQLSDTEIHGLARRAHRLLRANREAGPRRTTGEVRGGQETWV